MIGVAADISTDEAKLVIRRLELEAYYCLVNAFRASGHLTKKKLRILQDLSLYFQLSTERHQAEVRRAVNDEELTALADLVTKDDSSYGWVCEGRHPVPIHDDDKSYILPRNLKLRKDLPKLDKHKDIKPLSVAPPPKSKLNTEKGTQTPAIKPIKDDPDVKQELKNPIDMISNTQDLLPYEILEKLIQKSTNSLIVYLAYDNNVVNENKDLPDLHQPSVVIPLRVDELFGKMILEHSKTAQDATGTLQLPLDLAKITKERLEKKPKQRRVNKQQPGIDTASGASAITPPLTAGPTQPPVKRRRKKSHSHVTDATLHEVIIPTLTTPEPQIETKKDIVKIGVPPPLLAKAPQYETGTSGYHPLPPPMLQKMPGISHHHHHPHHPATSSTPSPHKPLSSSASSTPSYHQPSPSKHHHSQSSKSTGSHGNTVVLSRHRTMDDVVGSDPLQNLPSMQEVTSERSRHSHDKHWSEGTSSQHRRHYPSSTVSQHRDSSSDPNSTSQHRDSSSDTIHQATASITSTTSTTSSKGGRKYLTTQDLTTPHQLRAHEQWISEHLGRVSSGAVTPTTRVTAAATAPSSRLSGSSSSTPKKQSGATPEKYHVHEAIKQEQQRIKWKIEMEDQMRRTEELERQREDERIRIEERLKADEKLRAEEKRQSSVRHESDSKHKSAKDEGKAFSKHDPPSYLSTFMPKSGVQSKVQSKPSRSYSRTGKIIELDPAKQQDHMGGYKSDSTKTTVRLESISGQKVSITTSEYTKGVRLYNVEKADTERANPKPTIQILTQPVKVDEKKEKYAGYQPSAYHSKGSSSSATSGSNSGTLPSSAPTICVKPTKQFAASSANTGTSNKPSPLITYTPGKMTSEQITSMYQQQVLQQQLSIIQHSGGVRGAISLYGTASKNSKDLGYSGSVVSPSSGKGSGKEVKVTPMYDINELLYQQHQLQAEQLQKEREHSKLDVRTLADQKVANKILSDQQRQISSEAKHRTFSVSSDSSTVSALSRQGSESNPRQGGSGSGSSAVDSQKHLPDHHRHAVDSQKHLPDHHRHVMLQQIPAGYRLSTSPSGSHVIVGKISSSGYDTLQTPYTMALANQASSSKSKSGAESRKSSQKQGYGSLPSTKQGQTYTMPPGKPFGQYIQAQLTKPHQTPGNEGGRSRKGAAPEDVFKFPDDDEERSNVRRLDDRQKQGSGDRGVMRPMESKMDRTSHLIIQSDPDKLLVQRERVMSQQQKQILLHEKQMQEQRILHDIKVKEDIRKFEEEMAKHLKGITADTKQHSIHATPIVRLDDKKGVEVQHYLSPVSTPSDNQPPLRSHHSEMGGGSRSSDPSSRGLHPHLSITTPHLTLPSTVSSSGAGGIMLPQQTLQPGGYDGSEDKQSRKRKVIAQDHINTLLKAALSILQKTLKLRPKTRLINPSYPPHIWHQQSMDPKFIEKGLTPVDLMTVKKKLEFGEYTSFESFYVDVTHFQQNYSKVYPADHQLRQEIDEIMGVFLKELKEIYRNLAPTQPIPTMAGMMLKKGKSE